MQRDWYPDLWKFSKDLTDDFAKILRCGAQIVHLLVSHKIIQLRLLYPKILLAAIKFLDKISLLRKF